MIKRRTSTRRLLSHRPSKAEDTEKKLYFVQRNERDMPPFRPREEDAIRGLTNAKQEAARLTEALSEEEKLTVNYVVREYDGPRVRRIAMGPPKRDAYKARGR